MIFLRATDHPAEIRPRRRAIIGCAFTGSLGILLLDALILRPGVGYDLEDNIILYSVAVHNVMARISVDTWFRPLEYFVVLAANNVYSPLWLGASLLCVVGATILSALACELLFERQVPKAGWWVLGIANPLLFYLVSTPGTVSQALCNLLFAGAMLAFISELHRLRDQPASGWRADRIAVCINLMAAALFFTKELAVAAAVFLPAATALIRLKTRRLSRIFLFSLLIPIGAASSWMSIKLQLPLFKGLYAGERYGLKLNPLTWVQNFIITLAFPVTPLPSSFIAFDLLKPLWIVVALGSVTLFIGFLLRESLRQPKIVLPLLVVVASCAPMILIHSSELYSNRLHHSRCRSCSFSAFRRCVGLVWPTGYCFTLPPLETALSIVWVPILTPSAYNASLIPSIARTIIRIRPAPLERPLILLGMEPPLALDLITILAIKGGSSAFDKYQSHCGSVVKGSSSPPTGSFPDGTAENSAVVAPIAPIKTGIAFFVSGLLQGIEPPDVVDHASDALRELPHRWRQSGGRYYPGCETKAQPIIARPSTSLQGRRLRPAVRSRVAAATSRRPVDKLLDTVTF
jgi:hypothetical protein